MSKTVIHTNAAPAAVGPLREACQLLGIRWEASQPDVRQTDARAERCSRDMLGGPERC